MSQEKVKTALDPRKAYVEVVRWRYQRNSWPTVDELHRWLPTYTRDDILAAVNAATNMRIDDERIQVTDRPELLRNRVEVHKASEQELQAYDEQLGPVRARRGAPAGKSPVSAPVPDPETVELAVGAAAEVSADPPADLLLQGPVLTTAGLAPGPQEKVQSAEDARREQSAGRRSLPSGRDLLALLDSGRRPDEIGSQYGVSASAVYKAAQRAREQAAAAAGALGPALTSPPPSGVAQAPAAEPPATASSAAAQAPTPEPPAAEPPAPPSLVAEPPAPASSAAVQAPAPEPTIPASPAAALPAPEPSTATLAAESIGSVAHQAAPKAVGTATEPPRSDAGAAVGSARVVLPTGTTITLPETEFTPTELIEYLSAVGALLGPNVRITCPGLTLRVA